VPRSPNVSAVPSINESPLSPEYIISVKDLQSPNSVDKTKIIIKNRNITYLVYTTKMVVKYWCIFNLNDGSKTVVLYKRIIVKAGVKAKVDISIIKTNIHIRSIIRNEKVKLSILKNGKLNTVFHKNKGLALVNIPGIIRCDTIIGMVCPSRSTEKHKPY
jgi:hypothetical protein